MIVRGASPLFVGRADELAELGRALAQARDGIASTFLVGGEAGMGKTRLVREFSARAGDAWVLVGGCLELGTEGLPFAPFTAVLRILARDLGHDGVAALVPGGSTRGLARLLPEFGEPEPDGGEARLRLFEQMLGLLEHLADDRPVVLVIEDAHWADRSTRDLLSFLVRYRRPDARLLVVVTYRTDEIHRRHPLRPMLAELTRLERVGRRELRGLRRRHVVEQVAGILCREPAPAVVDTIYARSEGNPLFVEALLSGDGQRLGHEALPESLRDLLWASVERLPEETRELLRVASAGGARIEHRLLAAVGGHDDTALASALRPAVAGNVLTVEGDDYAFRHALIHEAVHDDLLPGERIRLHTRFAEALAADPSLLPAPRGAIELAHHWYVAHDRPQALVSAWRAAAAARTATAYGEQLRMLERVLELWETVPDAAERVGVSHAGVLRTAVTVAHLAGEFERGLALAKAAVAEIDPAAHPVMAAHALRQRALVAFELGREGYIDDLRAAVRLVPASPPIAVRGRLLENLARLSDGPANRAERIAYAEEAMAIARQVGDTATEAQALTTLTWNHQCLTDDLETRLADFTRAREIGRRAGAYYAVLRASISESDVLEDAGWHERAAQVARDGIAEASRYGLARTSGSFMAINLAEPLVSLGRWDEALRVVEHTVELVPPPPYHAHLLGSATDIALARGELDRAESLYTAARSLLARGKYRAQTALPHARREFELAHARGRADEAAALVARVLREHDLPSDPRYAWPVLVEGIRVAGTVQTGPQHPAPPQPGELVAELSALAERLEVHGLVQRANALTFAAEAARITGSADLTAWDAAAAAWAAVRQPYAEARVLVTSAEVAVSGGRRDDAARRLERARELLEGLGAAPLTARIAELARRAGLALPGAEPEEGRPAPGLTARETEVLRLVAMGRSNREIAHELFISVKTVSVHVSNILAKMGAGTRGEAAATAHRLRLFDDPVAPGPD